MKTRLRWSGFAVWNYDTERWSVVLYWWVRKGFGLFINSPRYCRNFGRIWGRPTSFDKLVKL